MHIWKNWGYIIKERNKDQQSINKEGTNEKTIQERPIILLTSLTFALTQYAEKNIGDKSQNKIRNRNKQQTTNNKLMMQTIGDANTHKYPMLKLKMQTERDILVIPNWRCRARGRLRAWAIEREGDRATERDRDQGETENESESETEREIESMWESLIARLRKSEWVDSKIERGRGRLRKWVMRE